eukprot:m.303087 g.303087  ORF g.303087 m.303087 type:complete len:273 (+) comp15647_c0_seq1:87-905(+)
MSQQAHSQPDSKGSGLKIIGAGWGRTGTDSTKTALDLLGYRCQHMKVLFGSPSSVQRFWAHALQRKFGPPLAERRIWEKEAAQLDWNSEGFAGGYDACVDFPFAPFYKELMEANPDAKVILTVRDNSEAWYRSAYKTIYGFQRVGGSNGLLFWLLQFVWSAAPIPSSIWEGVLQGTMEDKDKAIALYEQHIAEVKQIVPASRLLVFNVKQGWEPLCSFLDKPVPTEPFPNVNSTAEMQKAVTILYIVERITRVLAACLVLSLVYFVVSFLQQ